jgi:hypothetical protein
VKCDQQIVTCPRLGASVLRSVAAALDVGDERCFVTELVVKLADGGAQCANVRFP